MEASQLNKDQVVTRNEYDNIPDHIPRLRKSIADFVDSYLKHRDPKNLIGEFLDTEGCQHQQFGFAGIGFLLGLKKRHGFEGKALIAAEELIVDGLPKADVSRTEEQKKVLKDFFKIPTKSVLLSLFYDDEQFVNLIIKDIFENSVVKNLIKPSTNQISTEGNSIVTAHVLQIIHFSGPQFKDQFKSSIANILKSLKDELNESETEIHRCLFISTTLCLYEYEKNITKHKSLLKKLYKSDSDWSMIFMKENSLLEVWYPDGEGGRYLKVPNSYVILSAIYITFGSEKKFFKFRPVKNIFSKISTSFEEYSRNDQTRSRSTAYNLFFTFAALYPARYFRVPESPWYVCLKNGIDYRLENLTKVGWSVLILTVLGVIRCVFLVFELTSNESITGDRVVAYSNLFTTIAVIVIGFLALMRTWKR